MPQSSRLYNAKVENISEWVDINAFYKDLAIKEEEYYHFIYCHFQVVLTYFIMP